MLKFLDESGPSTILATHLSGSNLSDQPCAVQRFGHADLDALKDLLGIPQS